MHSEFVSFDAAMTVEDILLDIRSQCLIESDCWIIARIL